MFYCKKHGKPFNGYMDENIMKALFKLYVETRVESGDHLRSFCSNSVGNDGASSSVVELEIEEKW